MVYVNYHRERQVLESVVTPSVRRSTLFVTGREEFGKTELLQWFKDTHGPTKQVCYIDVADPAAALTPRAAMNTFVADLGARCFQEYWDAHNAMAANVSVIRGVTVNGSGNHIEASSGASIKDQLANLVPLTQAFVAGVSAASSEDRPVILCIDGYGSTEDLTRLWIRQQLVRWMRTHPNTYLIIASRTPPDRELLVEDRNLETIELRGIHDVNEWLDAARELNCNLPVDEDAEVALRVLINYTQGEPGGIMRWLRTGTPRRL